MRFQASVKGLDMDKWFLTGINKHGGSHVQFQQTNQEDSSESFGKDDQVN